MIQAKIIADSISESRKRITTFQLIYPRFIHAEFMTHRVFSRNASSSRAIPVRKMIELVRSEPAMPIHWGKNIPGMQANEEIQHVGVAKDIWLRAAQNAANIAEEMDQIGLHKQVANRILEPFQHIHVLVTSTEWDNFFELRCHKDAQPEIQKLAYDMQFAMSQYVPILLQEGDWHLPYADDWGTLAAVNQHVTDSDLRVKNNSRESTRVATELLRKVSAARCCRVSYLTHEGRVPNVEEDLKLCERLAGARPIHASPFEHQATPDVLSPSDYSEGSFEWDEPELHGNFVGWIQFRKQIEQSFNN